LQNLKIPLFEAHLTLVDGNMNYQAMVFMVKPKGSQPDQSNQALVFLIQPQGWIRFKPGGSHPGKGVRLWCP
jgi:hypothetical protein